MRQKMKHQPLSGDRSGIVFEVGKKCLRTLFAWIYRVGYSGLRNKLGLRSSRYLIAVCRAVAVLKWRCAAPKFLPIHGDVLDFRCFITKQFWSGNRRFLSKVTSVLPIKYEMKMYSFLITYVKRELWERWVMQRFVVIRPRQSRLRCYATNN